MQNHMISEVPSLLYRTVSQGNMSSQSSFLKQPHSRFSTARHI